MSVQKRHAFFPEGSFGRHVQDVCGDDVLIRLCEAIGGQDARLPKPTSALKDDHWLVQAVGRANADAICRAFAGEQVYIPRLSKDYLCVKHTKDGLTIKEIGLRIGVSERHVRRIMSALGIKNQNAAARRLAAKQAARTDMPALIAAE